MVSTSPVNIVLANNEDRSEVNADLFRVTVDPWLGHLSPFHHSLVNAGLVPEPPVRSQNRSLGLRSNKVVNGAKRRHLCRWKRFEMRGQSSGNST